MAALDDWGAGSSGAEHNDAALSHEKFRPLDPKAVTPGDREAQVRRVTDSVSAATPSERRAGARFYDRAHRDALRVGLGMRPGMQPYDSPSRRVDKERMSPTVYDHLRANPGERQEAVLRGAGAIAALSPSSPAGMDWEHNPTAAYEATRLTPGQVGHFRAAKEASGTQSRADGALRVAKKSGSRSDIRAAQRESDTASAAAKSASDLARDTMKASGVDALHHAGNGAILRAHEILSGERAPEDVLPMRAKTGHFYRNIADPRGSDGVTVDGRSHDIALGRHLPWDTNRGLGAVGRYNHFVDVHQEAARRTGMRPHQAQAVSWIQDKNAMMAKASPARRALGQAGKRAD